MAAGPFFQAAAQQAQLADRREILSVGFTGVHIKNPQNEQSQYLPDVGFVFPADVNYSGDSVATQLQYAPTGTYSFTFRATNASAAVGLIE